MAVTGLNNVKKPDTSKAGTKPSVDYTEHLEAKAAVGTITTKQVAKVDGQEVIKNETSKQEAVTTPMFKTPGAALQISVGGGRTLNMGNYESARLDVSLTMPCDPTTLEDAYDFATDWISEKLIEAEKAAKGQ